MLYNDKELFMQAVLEVSENTGISVGIVEKDYYVTMLLKAIVENNPDVIFKGGTSLSKCYKIIERFSEDIDLNIKSEGKPSQGEKRNLKESITKAISTVGLEFSNPAETRSRREFNRYLINYPRSFVAGYLKPQVIVETSLYIAAYPYNKMTATSMIYDYYSDKNMPFIKEYGLEPFEVNVQSAERTLIDKVFALGDYYLGNRIEEHSRHIYDIHKLLTIVEINDDVKKLALDVRNDRKNHHACLSAQDNVNMVSLIREVIDTATYMDDYETITSKLLFTKCTYDESIQSLERCIDIFSS